jgi:tetratricopeptide (TPR) repeat protein
MLAGLILAAVKGREELAVRADAREARRLVSEGRFRAAQPYLQRWLQARPKSAEAAFLVAKGMFAFQMPEAGLEALDRARDLGYPARAIERERAIVLSHLSRYPEAEPVLRRLASAPGARDPGVDEALTRCYVETFQLRAAQESVERWVRDAPHDPRAYYWRAEVGRKTNADTESLIRDYAEALRLDPGLDPARLNLAELNLSAHRLREAESLYRTYLDRRPNDAAGHLGLGQALGELGDPEGARHELTRAVELAPRDVRPLVEQAKLDIRAGRLDAALATLDRAIATDASEPEPHYQRSLILARLGRPDEAKSEREATNRLRQEHRALSDILLALYQSPNDLRLQLQSAHWLFDHNHPEEGLKWAEKILRDHPQHVETHRLLADYYEKIGNMGQANYHRIQSGGAAGRR